MLSEWIQRFVECDEIAWDQSGSLVDELIERMLPIRARLAPVDWSRLEPGRGSFERNVLAVAFHGQLLEVCWKSLQILLIRQNRDGFGAQKIVVPDGDQAH